MKGADMYTFIRSIQAVSITALIICGRRLSWNFNLAPRDLFTTVISSSLKCEALLVSKLVKYIIWFRNLYPHKDLCDLFTGLLRSTQRLPWEWIRILITSGTTAFYLTNMKIWLSWWASFSIFKQMKEEKAKLRIFYTFSPACDVSWG